MFAVGDAVQFTVRCMPELIGVKGTVVWADDRTSRYRVKTPDMTWDCDGACIEGVFDSDMVDDLKFLYDI